MLGCEDEADTSLARRITFLRLKGDRHRREGDVSVLTGELGSAVPREDELEILDSIMLNNVIAVLTPRNSKRMIA